MLVKKYFSGNKKSYRKQTLMTSSALTRINCFVAFVRFHFSENDGDDSNVIHFLIFSSPTLRAKYSQIDPRSHER